MNMLKKQFSACSLQNFVCCDDDCIANCLWFIVTISALAHICLQMNVYRIRYISRRVSLFLCFSTPTHNACITPTCEPLDFSLRVTKFYIGVSMDGIMVDLENQGYRSKVKVTMSLNRNFVLQFLHGFNWESVHLPKIFEFLFFNDKRKWISHDTCCSELTRWHCPSFNVYDTLEVAAP